MPKRPCPFEFNLLPQLKVRLGQKDYDLIKHKNMSKIHDKTMQLLFNGTKQYYGEHEKTINIYSKPCMDTTSSENKCCLKNVSEFCSVCNDLNVAENKCSFCDKWICETCSALCYKCSHVFCVAHLIKLYGPNDNCICLNC